MINKWVTYFQLSIAVRVFVCCMSEIDHSMFPVNCQTKTSASNTGGQGVLYSVTGRKKMQTISWPSSSSSIPTVHRSSGRFRRVFYFVCIPIRQIRSTWKPWTLNVQRSLCYIKQDTHFNLLLSSLNKKVSALAYM